MGPVWDFEWSLGVGWYYGERPRPANYYVYESGAFYYDRLLRDPVFTAELKRQWQQTDITQDILQHIDETEEMLQQSQALNFRRWDILNIRVSYGGIPLGSYEKEVACDRAFFISHMNWLHEVINEWKVESGELRVESGKWKVSKTYNLQLSTPNFQLSTFNFQLSTYNSQLSTFNL
jgi:hypothetical protein